MATVIDAQNFLISHLQDMPGRPQIAYPNGPIVETLPRIVISIPAPGQRTFTLKGGTMSFPEIIARVEVKDGEFATEASAIAAAIIDHYPAGKLRDGVSIVERPRPVTPYRSDGVYHIPVIIRGKFAF